MVIITCIPTPLVEGGERGGSSWTIVESISVPEGASGLAWDGTNLYFGIYGVDGSNIYQLDPATGTHTLLFIGEQEDAFGLSFDGAYLWTTDHAGSSSVPAQAIKLDWDGNVIEQFDLPDHYMSGIACDGEDVWVSRYYPDPGHLYKLDGGGAVLHEFDGPDDQPWDLAIGENTIWIADYWGDTLFSVDPLTGAVIQSHASEGVEPAGIVWDGQYLWYCDNGDNYEEDILYKVDLQGGGTPEIIVADSEHDFGQVAIGDMAVWNLLIQNTGTASLVIDDVAFDPLVDLTCTTDLPLGIPAGGTHLLSLEYTPGSFGPLETTASITSNDPIHPEEELMLSGHGVYIEPTLDVATSALGFGLVRVGAHTRWFIEVSNHGDQALVIDELVSDQSVYYVDPEIELPMTLETLESAQIGVWFSPTSTSTVLGMISISSNDTDQDPTQVFLSGGGDDASRPIGTELWSSEFTDDWDNSFKAMSAIGDVSGDGRDDLIACSEDNFIRCFNGNADQSGDVLWAHEIYSGNIYSDKGLDVIEDIDGDGFDEVVVGATGGARLIRMLSGRTGSELWTYNTDVIGSGGWVYQVDGSRDFTGDGVADVLACAGDDGEDSGPKRAYCINGIDGVLEWQRPLGGPVFAIMAIDDFTGDGVPDVVAGASNQNESQGRAVGINGSTGVEEWSFYTSGSSVWSLAQLGDITMDGVNDVVIGDFGNGQFHGLDSTDGSQIYSGGGLSFLTGFKRIEDVNGDGHPEIVPEYFQSAVRVISGADGSTVWSTSVADNPTVVSAIADVSGDGINDLVVGTLFSDNYTYFLDGVGGGILQSMNFGTPVDAITVIPDVVGDGSWELVAGGRDGTIACISGGLDAVVFNPADINEDGFVNVDDLLFVIGQWGMIGSPADISGDGVVGVDDLLMVIAAWGDGV
jgi:hypothetical protein